MKKVLLFVLMFSLSLTIFGITRVSAETLSSEPPIGKNYFNIDDWDIHVSEWGSAMISWDSTMYLDQDTDFVISYPASIGGDSLVTIVANPYQVIADEQSFSYHAGTDRYYTTFHTAVTASVYSINLFDLHYVTNETMQLIQIEKGTVPTEFEPYGYVSYVPSLFDLPGGKNYLNPSQFLFDEYDNIVSGGFDSSNGNVVLKPNTDYVVSSTEFTANNMVSFYDVLNDIWISDQDTATSTYEGKTYYHFQTTDGYLYWIAFYDTNLSNTMTNSGFPNYQLEEGILPTSYEPYISYFDSVAPGGKNLINPVDFYVDNDGGSMMTNDYTNPILLLKSDTRYVFSYPSSYGYGLFNLVNHSDNDDWLEDENSSWSYDAMTQTYYYSFRASDTGDGYYHMRLFDFVSNTFTSLDGFQLEEGSTPTFYEPYRDNGYGEDNLVDKTAGTWSDNGWDLYWYSEPTYWSPNEATEFYIQVETAQNTIFHHATITWFYDYGEGLNETYSTPLTLTESQFDSATDGLRFVATVPLRPSPTLTSSGFRVTLSFDEGTGLDYDSTDYFVSRFVDSLYVGLTNPIPEPVDIVSPILSGNTVIYTSIESPIDLQAIADLLTATDETDGDVSGDIYIFDTDGYVTTNLTLTSYYPVFSVSDSAGNISSMQVEIRVVDVDDPIITFNDDPLTIDFQVQRNDYGSLKTTDITHFGTGENFVAYMTNETLDGLDLGTLMRFYLYVPEALGTNYSDAYIFIEGYNTGVEVFDGYIDTSSTPHIGDYYYVDFYVDSQWQTLESGARIDITWENTSDPDVRADIDFKYNNNLPFAYIGIGSQFPQIPDLYSFTDYDDNATFTFVDEINYSVPGTYNVEVTLTDSSGNFSTVDKLVYYVATTPAEITLTGASTVYVEFGSTYTELGATWIDDFDGTGNAVATGSVNVNTLGTYTITYTFTDSHGNVSDDVTRSVIVRDTSAPYVLGNITNLDTYNSMQEILDEVLLHLQVNDLYDGTLIVDSADISVSNYPGTTWAVGVYDMTLSIDDSSGNTLTYEFTITINDDIAPEWIYNTTILLTEAVANSMTQQEIKDYITNTQ